MDATKKGTVLTVANTMAVIAGLGTGTGRVVVTDVDLSHLAGVQAILSSAKFHNDYGGWIAEVKQRHPAVGAQIETICGRLKTEADFSALKRRVDADGFDFVHTDLADCDIGKLKSLSPGGYSAIYASNIEMYLSGFCKADAGVTDASKLAQYKSNIVNLMGDETKLIHGAFGVQMNVTNGIAKTREWTSKINGGTQRSPGDTDYETLAPPTVAEGNDEGGKGTAATHPLKLELLSQSTNVNAKITEATVRQSSRENSTTTATDQTKGMGLGARKKGLRAGLKLEILRPTEEGGKILGSGLCGTVREDTEFPGFVVKSFGKSIDLAHAESALFNKYYGEGSSEVFSKDNNIFMRMLRVPGKPLSSCSQDELPTNSEELFLRMITDLNDHGIMHGDLHAGNIMYDKDSSRFWPIDISNSYDAYYADPLARGFVDIDNETRFQNILKKLPRNSGVAVGESAHQNARTATPTAVAEAGQERNGTSAVEATPMQQAAVETVRALTPRDQAASEFGQAPTEAAEGNSQQFEAILNAPFSKGIEGQHQALERLRQVAAHLAADPAPGIADRQTALKALLNLEFVVRMRAIADLGDTGAGNVKASAVLGHVRLVGTLLKECSCTPEEAREAFATLTASKRNPAYLNVLATAAAGNEQMAHAVGTLMKSLHQQMGGDEASAKHIRTTLLKPAAQLEYEDFPGRLVYRGKQKWMEQHPGASILTSELSKAGLWPKKEEILQAGHSPTRAGKYGEAVKHASQYAPQPEKDEVFVDVSTAARQLESTLKPGLLKRTRQADLDREKAQAASEMRERIEGDQSWEAYQRIEAEWLNGTGQDPSTLLDSKTQHLLTKARLDLIATPEMRDAIARRTAGSSVSETELEAFMHAHVSSALEVPIQQAVENAKKPSPVREAARARDEAFELAQRDAAEQEARYQANERWRARMDASSSSAPHEVPPMNKPVVSGTAKPGQADVPPPSSQGADETRDTTAPAAASNVSEKRETTERKPYVRQDPVRGTYTEWR
ncbi:hypothetical protein [Trinickia fusca]|uniref:OspG family effector kinase n=1 Tax=Trinickia fusca TaxID=2419777 RepID=UPI003CCC50E1